MITASGFMDDGTLEPKGFEMPSSLHGRAEGREAFKVPLSYSSVANNGPDYRSIHEYVSAESDAALYTMERSYL